MTLHTLIGMRDVDPRRWGSERDGRSGGTRRVPPSRRPPPFEEFLEANRTAVYRFLLASAGPDADDCFQETFLSALRAYPRLRDGSNLRAWALAIATRKVIDAARARAKRPVPAEDVGEAASPPDPAPVDANDPLWRALRSLPPRQRAAVAHRFVLDLSYAEIAAALDSSEEAARANVYQGLKKLRERLGNDDDVEE
jgi:RNA polymerase sigma factor (sigma-70 family)